MKFKDSFTANLPKHVRNRIHTITVKTDFNNLPSQGSGDNVDGKLCQRAFDLLNIEKTLRVTFRP